MEELTKAERDALQAFRSFGLSIRATSDVLGIDRDTVRDNEPDDAKEYDAPGDYADKTWENIQQALPADVTPANVVESNWLPDDEPETDTPANGGDPFQSETDERLRVTDDYGSLTPGEFIETFFDDLEVGVQGQFITLQSRRADRKEELPDEEKMRSDLEGMKSGVTGRTAQYVAEEYWDAAQEYISETRTSVFRRGDAGAAGATDGAGSTVSVNETTQQQGGWMQMPDGSQRYGRMEPDGNGGMRFIPMTPPQQGGQRAGAQGGQQPQQNAEVQALRDELREMRREMQDGGPSSFREQIQEMREMQSAIQELQADGARGADEAMKVLRNEIRTLRNEVQGGGAQMDTSNPREAVVQRMLANESMDEQTIMDALDRIEGQTDPQIREMEIEQEMEKRKMEQQKERQEKLFSSLDRLVETGATVFAERLRGDADSEDTTAADGGTPSQGAQGGAAAGANRQVQNETVVSGGRERVEWDCPQCGETTEQATRIPGRRCGNCDFARVPCPDCSNPTSIPPIHERDKNQCPDCEQPVPIPDDLSEKAACHHCEWVGPAEDAAGEVVTCEECGGEHPVQPDPAGV